MGIEKRTSDLDEEKAPPFKKAKVFPLEGELPTPTHFTYTLIIPPGLKNDKEAREPLLKLKYAFQTWLQSLPEAIKTSATFKAAFSQDVAEYIKNAIDAGARELSCSIEKNDTEVVILFADNGQGFPVTTMPLREVGFTDFRKDILPRRDFKSTKKKPHFFGGHRKFLDKTSQAVEEWEGGRFLIKNIGDLKTPAGAIIQIGIPIHTKKILKVPVPQLDDEEFVLRPVIIQ